jgi:hypothetical protein
MAFKFDLIKDASKELSEEDEGWVSFFVGYKQFFMLIFIIS